MARKRIEDFDSSIFSTKTFQSEYASNIQLSKFLDPAGLVPHNLSIIQVVK
jgi:hypothetical protein